VKSESRQQKPEQFYFVCFFSLCQIALKFNPLEKGEIMSILTLKNLTNQTKPSFSRHYHKLAEKYESINTARAIDRLEYRFNHYSDGFYKFLEPCKHPLYRKGDSWAEELGMSRKTLHKTLKPIARRYNSKQEFDQAEDKFEGYLYAYYYKRDSNQYNYLRNHPLANEILGPYYGRKGPEITDEDMPEGAKLENSKKPQTLQSSNHDNPQQNVILPLKGKSEEPEINEISNRIETAKIVQDTLEENSKSVDAVKDKCRSGTGKFPGPYARARVLRQINTSSLRGEVEESKTKIEESEKFEVTEGMINIWKKVIGNLDKIQINNGSRTRLYQAYQEKFSSSMIIWQQYCEKISSSSFLMGEKNNRYFKKAYLFWAIGEKGYSEVIGGHYQFGDRETQVDKQISSQGLELKHLANQREQAKLALEHRSQDLEQQRKKLVRQQIETLSEAEHQPLRQEFEVEAQQRTDAVGEVFRESGWNGPHIAMMYWLFLSEKISTKLFSTSHEEEYNHDEKRKQIERDLRDLEEKIVKAQQGIQQIRRTKQAFMENKPEEKIASTHIPIPDNQVESDRKLDQASTTEEPTVGFQQNQTKVMAMSVSESVSGYFEDSEQDRNPEMNPVSMRNSRSMKQRKKTAYKARVKSRKQKEQKLAKASDETLATTESTRVWDDEEDEWGYDMVPTGPQTWTRKEKRRPFPTIVAPKFSEGVQGQLEMLQFQNDILGSLEAEGLDTSEIKIVMADEDDQ